MKCWFCAIFRAYFWPSGKRINSILLLIGTRQTFWLILVEAHVNFSYPFRLYSPVLRELYSYGVVFEGGKGRYLNIFGKTVIFLYQSEGNVPSPQALGWISSKMLTVWFALRFKTWPGKSSERWILPGTKPLPALECLWYVLEVKCVRVLRLSPLAGEKGLNRAQNSHLCGFASLLSFRHCHFLGC